MKNNSKAIIIISLMILEFCSSSCDNLYDYEDADEDYTNIHEAWGELDKNASYVLIHDMFIHPISRNLNYSHFAYNWGESWSSQKVRSEYSEVEYPNVKVAKSGTKIRFRSFTILRRIWGNAPSVTVEIIEGENEGMVIGAEELVKFVRISDVDWFISSHNDQMIAKNHNKAIEEISSGSASRNSSS